MIKYNRLLAVVVIFSLSLLFSSCRKEQSPTTGWYYNDPKWGGFEVAPYLEQETGPGLVFIEGGTFTMGRTEQDVRFDWNNIPRRVTVSSFYIDQTEVRNLDYVEYLYWLSRVYGLDNPEVYKKALPDTLMWREKLAYNEPMVEYYLRHPAYRDYPVVGINWLQARDFCSWRTDRVNEYILITAGILEVDPDQQNENNFNTESYLAGQYEGLVRRDLPDLDPRGAGTRKVRMEDGIFLPRYRLPTEAEWEYAALGLIGNTIYERVVERKIYPWNGHITRTDASKNYGDFVANFMRGRGDMMGVAGNLNDAADIPAVVWAYWPNDFGLYNMAGNVAEWVMDVYRPLSFEDFSEFRPFRGNVFETKVLNSDGTVADKYDMVIYDVRGVRDYLLSMQEPIEERGIQAEVDLFDQIIAVAESAVEDKNNNLGDDVASEKIVQILETIANSELAIGGTLTKGISDFITAIPGQLKKRPVTIEENLTRLNYRKADNINYLDGDYTSTVSEGTDWLTPPENADDIMYDYGVTSLISNRARVYKGGSWRDRAYWLSPGARRFLDERKSTDFIGFRCAMSRVGSPVEQ